jgi:hypothetical protein
MKLNGLFLVAGWFAAAFAPGVVADDVLYNNTASTAIGEFWPSSFEAGNQVILAGSGTSAQITQFQFQYYNNDPASTEKLEFRIYANDGAEYSPGDPTSKEPGAVPLFDSGKFSAPTTPLSSVTFTTSDFGPGGLTVPTSFTWTVQFSQTGGGGHAGVELYSGHTVGGAYDDVWVNTGTWVLSPSNPPNSNFGAEITGFEPVPEPSPAQLGLLCGVVFLARRMWKGVRSQAQ